MGDLLPYYPWLVAFGELVLIGGFLIILRYSTGVIIIFVLLTIGYIILMPLFVKWNSYYKLDLYENMIARLKKDPKIKIITFGEWLENPSRDKDKTLVILRHDVDKYLDRARAMAKIEDKFDIKSCYFLRFDTNKYTSEEIKRIVDDFTNKGFEIGLHYETLSRMDGDQDAGIELLEDQTTKFRKFYPLKMISSHRGSHDNTELEDHSKFEELELHSADNFDHDIFISETGGKHHFKRDGAYVTFPGQMKRLFPPPEGELVQILVHSDLWS